MKASELRPPPAIPLPPVIPVICDQCRAMGIAGDAAFSGIPDILEFTPVPRRAHVNNWTPEHQRAFIAALALTGSPRIAARTIGRHAFGAEQLKKARGGRSFADAWDAALDLARERELARIHGNLADLATQSLSPPSGGESWREGGAPDDPPEPAAYDPAAEAARHARICDRLLRGRRLFLAEISGDAGRRAAWELLCGPVDWDKARALKPQDNEPYRHLSLYRPDIALPAEHGWLGEITGGEDKMAQLRQGWEEYERTERSAADEDSSPLQGTEARTDAGGIGSTGGQGEGTALRKPLSLDGRGEGEGDNQ